MVTVKHDPTSRHTHFALVPLTALVSLLVGILWLVLARAGAVQAAGVVTNCSDDSQLSAKLAGGGLVTFNCLLPAPTIITVTVSGGLVTTPSTTIDASNNGNPITLSGGSTRLFRHIAAGSTLTLTHLTLRDGNAGADNGGCLYNEAGTAVLVDVTVTGCKVASGFAGGGIYNNGTATLTNVTLSANSATGGGAGGGIYNSGIGSMVTLNDSTLNGNSASGLGSEGGGIFNIGTATLNGSTLNDNSASNGGGIYSGGTTTLTNSTLSANTAGVNGGGIFNIGTATVKDSTLRGNSAGADGGGIYNIGLSTVTLNHSTLSGNSADGDGGGIYNIGANVAMLKDSTLSGNSAAHGGGIYNDNSGTATLDHSTLSVNRATHDGGGINNNGTATLTNSTLSGNQAEMQGGGIYNHFDVSLWNVTLSNNSATTGGALYIVSGYTTVLTNSIVAYSPTGGNCSGSISKSKYSISSDSTCALSGLVKGMNPNDLDPLLTALGNYGGPTQVHMLKLGSPAIDGVAGSDAPATDQRGLPRPQGAGFDIGAVERQPTDSDLAPRLYLPLIVR